MTPTHKAELLRKCRRLIYNPSTGAVAGMTSGGGATERLSGEEYIVTTFYVTDDDGNPVDPLTMFAAIEEYFVPLHNRKAIHVDIIKAQACHDAVAAHKKAVQDEADFVFEKGITLFGSEPPTTAALRHTLQVQEMHTRDDSGRVTDHDAIIQAQTDLEALCKTCEDCCEQLLVTRDAAVTFAEPES